MERTIRSGRVATVAWAAFDSEGDTSFWENVCGPIRDAGGEIFAAAGVCRNGSSRVSLEAEVRDRNSELGQLVDPDRKKARPLVRTGKSSG